MIDLAIQRRRLGVGVGAATCVADANGLDASEAVPCAGAQVGGASANARLEATFRALINSSLKSASRDVDGIGCGGGGGGGCVGTRGEDDLG